MSRFTKIAVGLAALAAFALGGAALATAGGDGTTTAATITAATPPTATQEVAGTETNDTAGDQSPSYKGSIVVPEQDGANEQAEAAALKAKATVTEAQAKDAALAAVAGTAGLVELDNENGSVVYSVEVKKADGTTVDVKVDAGNAKVLAQDAGEKDGAEAAEAGETPEAAGTAEAPEAPETGQPGTTTQP